MRDERPRPRSLESLRKEAKRWHAALRGGEERLDLLARDGAVGEALDGAAGLDGV